MKKDICLDFYSVVSTSVADGSGMGKKSGSGIFDAHPGSEMEKIGIRNGKKFGSGIMSENVR
jgi:hypothetical protein